MTEMEMKIFRKKQKKFTDLVEKISKTGHFDTIDFNNIIGMKLESVINHDKVCVESIYQEDDLLNPFSVKYEMELFSLSCNRSFIRNLSSSILYIPSNEVNNEVWANLVVFSNKLYGPGDDKIDVPSMWPKTNPNISYTVSHKTYQPARNDILAKRFGIPHYFDPKNGKKEKKQMKNSFDLFNFTPKRINFRMKKGNYYTDVLWEDGTVTVVKLRDGEDFDEYSAFCAALAKKVFGSTNAVNTIVKKTACYPLTKAQKKNVERKEEVDRMDAEYRKE